MADILIFGTGQIADVAKAYFDAHSPDRVVGFTVDKAYMRSSEHFGLPVVAWEELEQTFPPDKVKIIGPLSYQSLNEFRRLRHSDGKERGYTFTSFIHPSAQICNASIGENCFILENCIIQPYTRIGDGCIIWSATHIGHHTVIGDYCFLSSQIGISSGVTIGDDCFIGGQVGIINGMNIGNECFLESRSVIRRDLPSGSVVRHPHDLPKNYSSARLKGKRFS